MSDKPSVENDQSGGVMHRWVEPHGDLTACGIRWWNGTRGEARVTCSACAESGHGDMRRVERALLATAIPSGVTGSAVAGVSVVVGSPWGTVAGGLCLLAVAVIYRYRRLTSSPGGGDRG